MLYGAAYYHEYQPYERLAKDIEMMRDAGLSLARVGESVWSTWEPADGQFDLDWMQRILDALHAADIKVILGTPTYAIPPWLHRKHPEIMRVGDHGRKVHYGARQNIDLSHPAFLFHAERVVRAIAARYAGHPAVIGWQIDNETGTGMAHNPGVFQSFVDYLKGKFGTVERLNEVWGLTYWSHRLGDWADLWTADDNTTPGYDLEWRRFQSKMTADFLDWQARIVREYARPDQFITQCLVGGHGRPDADRFEIAKSLDVVAENPYHPMQDALALPPRDEYANAPSWLPTGGVWSLFLNGDLGRGAKGSNFLVTEVNALSIGGSHNNFPGYDGQWRLAAFTYISRGANAVEYWHWHTLHYGAETYWTGVLNHDLEPNRCYREVSRIGHELRKHGDLLTDLRVDADVAFLYSQDSKYAQEFQPCLSTPGTAEADRRSYQRTFNAFYKAYFDAGAQTAVVSPEGDFAPFKALVAPCLYIADEALQRKLLDYVAAGGHLVLTFRAGYADEFARARWTKAPGILRGAVGASYNEYSNLAESLPLRAEAGFALPLDAAATAWADGLEIEDAEPLVWYDHPHFGRFPAVVSHAHGAGRVTYVGCLPNAEFGESIAEWVLGQAGVEPVVPNLPASVRATTARAKSGQRLWFLTNWSCEPAIVPALPVGGRELFTGESVTAGGQISLGAWDVKIVVE